MARYSRSALGMLESVRELSAQRAEEFLNTFYFEYGHRSIADMAHVVLALENISILAALTVEDEPLWDGMERSTRYQDFRRSGYYLPPELHGDAADAFRAACDRLFASYRGLSRKLLEVLTATIERPDGMDEGYYTRTLRARAFDVARYLLPLAANTSVGQVVSARVLESQISRLLGDGRAELRAIGDELREAARRAPEAPLLDALIGEDAEIRERLAPPSAPTLVKHTAPSQYPPRLIEAVRERAGLVLRSMGAPDFGASVELSGAASLDVETAATLLYRASPDGHSYRQCLAAAAAMPDDLRAALLGEVFNLRGPHDDLPRELRAGAPLAFDLLIDLGAFRDFHRHRRCIQILPDLRPTLGIADPEETFVRGLTEAGAEAARQAGLLTTYREALEGAVATAAAFERIHPEQAAYLLPLGARCRALFKMDAAESVYLTELRTGVMGHFSYRYAAWDMAVALQQREPWLAGRLRLSNPHEVVDLLAR
ncbi:MAG: FAD-dependent thymidylate synthase [Chloroflexi bacterium]|nr:FAD-dependent thymidylate synthase [Chloroflexota bacterium]